MGTQLPSGTVTFLFTDIEGSTRLLEELGSDAYAAELGRHQDVVRGALDAHGGVEVDTQGDAFFCAFASAREAVACAQDIRAALAATPIRVRMGLHTGEALVADRRYVGMDVHRAARIGACGHGGQVVLSPSTVALLEPDAFTLVDLGEHRLKDLSAPVRLHQLGDGEFPPLKTLFRTNLPVPATPFLGREVELGALVERASEPGLRVLTLAGPGGTGKTRLALQLAGEISGAYPDGIWWVPLASLRDGALIASALAGVLEVDEEPGRPLVASVSDALGTKRALLLLDNCEHLVEEAAALAAAVVAACSRVLVLTTSREALAIAGEHVFPVQPLVATDALELFGARARAAGAALTASDAHVVAELCARLDNLPLAVELAAARAAALPPAALLERLSSGLDVLKGPRDSEERQRTLRATIAWSHSLLEEPEKALFRRLSVFVGGATLDAIEHVSEADLEDVLSLVAKSLVRQAHDDGAEPRYFMLETIREFAAAELGASEDGVGPYDRHLEWFAELARDASEGLKRAGSTELLAHVDRDLANCRAAFSYGFPAGRGDEIGALGRALAVLHILRGRYSEAEEVIRGALTLDLQALTAAELHGRLARVLRVRGSPDAALEELLAAEHILEGTPERDADWWKRWIDLKLDQASFFYFENAQERLAALVVEVEQLVEERGDPEQRLELMHVRCQHAYRRERYALSEETEALVRETYRRAVELGDPGAEFMFGFGLLWRGKPGEAEEHFVRGHEEARGRGIAILETRCRVYGAVARRCQGDVEGVREWLLELEMQDELHGYRGLTAANAAWLAYRDGDLDLASTRGAEALADWETRGLRGSRVFEWTARFPLLGVALARGELGNALAQGRAMLDESQQPLPAEIASALSAAVEQGSRERFERALEVARAFGYA